MPRDLKKNAPVDFESWKGLKHGRCGSHILSSKVEIPIGVPIEINPQNGRSYYVSSIYVSEGQTQTITAYLRRYIDNGETESIRLITPTKRWG